MHPNKWLLGTAVVMLIVAAGAVTWLHAAPVHTVGTLSANPAYVVVNTPTQVTFTISITDPAVLPTGVNLLETDATGKTIATLGVMHDDGTNGDTAAGDQVFSYQTTINQASVGQTYYRATAAFKGALQRTLSGVAQVTFDPVKLPPDPGDAGKQTLAGIDSDNDGVRDDVQRYIVETYASSAKTTAGLMQHARAVETLLVVTPLDATAARADAIRDNDSLDCLTYITGITQAISETDDVDARMLNTKARSLAYASYNRLLSGQAFALTPTAERKGKCDFDPDALPN